MTTVCDFTESEALFSGLTGRQRDVLDLLLQHKTSKEIARDLGISPHTVDQRIRFAKEKLGVHRRSDLATSYRELRSICGEPVYEESRIASLAIPLSSNGGSNENLNLIDRTGAFKGLAQTDEKDADARLVSAMFEGPTGGWTRIGAVFAIAASVIILGIGGLAVLEQLSRMIS